jgi:hypothetical protein
MTCGIISTLIEVQFGAEHNIQIFHTGRTQNENKEIGIGTVDFAGKINNVSCIKVEVRVILKISVFIL